MRLLINDVDAVKEKAFETLEEVTGINTKSGLQKLLIEMQIIETPVWDDVSQIYMYIRTYVYRYIYTYIYTLKHAASIYVRIYLIAFSS